ncbi:MAG: HPF/RaiA family ribosome-associated protein [Bacteroidia bacterium]
MIIQINTDNNINLKENEFESFQQQVNDSLGHYTEHISRIEIHLSDENGNKDGNKDKRCMLEARIEGKQPIAVVSYQNTIEESLNDAIDKICASLKTLLGQMKEHR